MNRPMVWRHADPLASGIAVGSTRERGEEAT